MFRQTWKKKAFPEVKIPMFLNINLYTIRANSKGITSLALTRVICSSSISSFIPLMWGGVSEV